MDQNEIEIREWRANQDTYAKAAEKHSKDLPDDEKVKANKGDVLRARVLQRKAETIIIADGVLNGSALADNIRVIQKFHWSRIEEEAPAKPAAPAPAVPSPRRQRAQFLKKRAAKTSGG